MGTGDWPDEMVGEPIGAPGNAPSRRWGDRLWDQSGASASHIRLSPARSTPVPGARTGIAAIMRFSAAGSSGRVSGAIVPPASRTDAPRLGLPKPAVESICRSPVQTGSAGQLRPPRSPRHPPIDPLKQHRQCARLSTTTPSSARGQTDRPPKWMRASRRRRI
jgi:hypothetical protein